MAKSSGLNRIIICLLIFTFSVTAEIIVPDNIKDQIVADVMSERGYFDAAEVEIRIRAWKLDQPQPRASGELTDSGNCGTSCTQSGGNASLPMPRNVEYKGKVINGNYTQNLIIKWKRPQALPDGSNLQLKNYKITLSKDGQTYEKYKVKAKFKNNGKPKKHQKLKLRGLEVGNYTVQIKANYKTISGSTTAKSSSLNKSSSSGSMWTGGLGGGVVPGFTIVSDLTSNPVLQQCILDGGFEASPSNGVITQATNNTLLENIYHLTCKNSNLDNSDILVLGSYLSGLTYLNIENSDQVTDISPININLVSLEWLDIGYSGGLDLTLAQNSLTNLDSLETLYIKGLNLVTIPDLPDSVTYLNLSKNKIIDNSGGFWPENPIDTLVINNNATAFDSNWTIAGNYSLTNNFFQQLGSTPNVDIKTIQSRNNAITNIDAFGSLTTLLNIDLKGNQFDSEIHLSSHNGKGLCSLSLQSSSLTKVKGLIPIQILSAVSSSSLEKVNLADSSQYRPASMNFTGSNSMSCNHRDKISQNTSPIITDMGLIPGSLISCPIWTGNAELTHADHCKPNAPKTVSVYEDVNSSRRYVHWEMNPNHSIAGWGITHYKITAKSGANVLNSFEVDHSSDKALTFFSLAADSYEVQACTELQCGDIKVASQADFKQGLSRPIDGLGIWDTTDSNNYSFQFRFKYPNDSFISTFGKPDKFVITPNFGQTDTIIPVEILVGSFNGNCDTNGSGPCNGDTSWWYSPVIAQNQYIGRDFSIKACRNDMGCGAHLNVRLGNPLTSEDMPVPQWVGSLNSDVSTGTSITLDWNDVVLSHQEVDYIEVTEDQPVRGAFTSVSTTPDQQTITYYIEKEGSRTLERLVRGNYSFKLKSCKRNRETGDVCSGFSAVKTVDLQRNDIPNSMIQNPTTIGFVDLTVQPGQMVPTLVWNSPNVTPDYYKFSVSGLGQCGTNGITSRIIETAEVNQLAVNLTAGGTQLMNTVYWTCPTLPTNSNFPLKISSCFKGIGCHDDYISASVASPLPVIGTATLDEDLVNGQGANLNNAGGPGDMRPGVWWNPQLSGTGWHFYWASELRYPSVHTSYGETYDLIGVWLTYQKINNEWTPIWMLSHMKAVDHTGDPEACNITGSSLFDCTAYFEGDLSYITRNGGVLTSTSLGGLQVYFEAGDGPESNTSALLKMDIDSNNGMLTMPGSLSQDTTVCDNSGTPVNDCLWIDENGNLNMPLSNFDQSILGNPAVGDQDNDINHYSGMWSPVDANGDVDTSFAYMVDIFNNLEWSALLMYDGQGLPMWALSDTCEGNPSCIRTGEGVNNMTYKTIRRGFDPLYYTPNNFWNKENNLVSIGASNTNGRIFKDAEVEDFNDMKMWANIDTMNQIPGRSRAMVNSGSAASPTIMAKQASFHDIRFFINGGDEVQTVCDPDHEQNGQCNIRFAWFTDDDFPAIKPFYRKDQSALLPLEDLCGLVVSDNTYVETEYQCDIYEPGVYDFELRKPSYFFGSDQLPEDWIQIAGSKTLEIMPCTTNNCEANTYTPLAPVTASENAYIGPDLIANGGNGSGTIQLTELPEPPTSSEQVGATKGQFTVTPGGAASYTIPILTAPASGGLQPQVALSYNSQGGRGALGMGWSVSGYSVVSRCAQTFEQDYDENSTEPLIQSVTFTDSDRFCVDGQRLMLVDSTATYGADNTVYYTEIFNGTKYISIGTQGSGPQCFEAWHKDGSVTLYGDCKIETSDDSAFVESGLPNGSALMWAQSRMTDDKGNYYTHHYHSNVVALDAFDQAVEFYLDEIKYSANDNVTGSTLAGSVKLIYESMPLSKVIANVVVSNYTDQNQSVPGWRNLSVKSLANNRKLVRIDSGFNSQPIRSYKLNYGDTDTSGTDLLTSIQECASSLVGANCYDPTVFDWGNTLENSIGATTSTPYLNLGNINDNEYVVTSLDANGDGYEDFYISGGIDKVYINNKNSNSFTSIAAPDLPKNFSIVDINADGFPDFTVGPDIYLWNGSGYESPVSIAEYGYDIKKYSDIDGDGLVDAIGIDSSVQGTTIGIFINRYDLTHGDSNGITAAFSVPTEIAVNFDSNNFLSEYESSFESGVFLPPYDQDNPEIKDIIALYDANNDGVSEILVEFEKDNWCFDQGSDCNDPSVQTVNTSVFAELHYQQGNISAKTYLPEYIGGSSACAACTETISAPMVVDIDGDGNLEQCYIAKSSDGLPDGGELICDGDNGGTSSSLNEIRQNNLIDLNGDGFLDLLYSKGTVNDTWQVKYTQWSNGKLSYSNSWTNTNIKSGNAVVDPNNQIVQQYLDKNLFFDINNDGLLDHMLFQVNRNNEELELFYSLGQNSNTDIDSKDKITHFTNGFGNQWLVNYGSMNDTEVYTRETNSINAWYGSERSPVFDFISPMALVASVEQTLPAWDVANSELNHSATLLNDWTQQTEYHYKNAKLQAGGRGFLGFGEFLVFDTNNNLLIQSKQSQDFPYIGSVKESKTLYVSDVANRLNVLSDSKDLSKPCWVDGSCEPEVLNIDICIPELGESCPVVLSFVDPVDATLLKHEVNNWGRMVLPGTNNRVYFPYVDTSELRNYELNGGEEISGIFTINSFNEAVENFWGNQTKADAYTLQGGVVVNRTITDYDYHYFNQGSGVINRLKQVKTESQLNGEQAIRITDYAYDANHLLYTETASSPGDSRTRVKTIHSRNEYGQPKQERLAGFDAIESRNKTLYDTMGRVAVESKTQLEGSYKTTNKVIQHNALGLPEITENAIGVKTFNKYDDMGRLFYTISETGAFSQTTYHDGAGSYCPSTTVYHSKTSSQVDNKSIAPDKWVCYDLLGREIRTVTQGFGVNQKIYVDQQYDTSGRVLAVSTPQLQPPSAANANHWSRTAYDELGRELLKRDPFAPTGPNGPQANLTAYDHSYDTVANKAKMMITNAMGHSTTTYTNALGQITQVTDANGGTVVYEYNAMGKQTKVDGALSGDNITTTYDAFDQVKTINDPNLGLWYYQYNVLGQLEYQVDAKGNCTQMVYDQLGRIEHKYYYTGTSDICTGGIPEDHIIYTYGNDVTLSSFGQLLSEQNNSTEKVHSYDELGRLVSTTSTLTGHGLVRTEDTYFDAYGRVKAVYDASGEGTLSLYNDQGYHSGIQGIRTSVNYQTILSQNAFGHVTKELTGNGIYTTRVYDVAGRMSLLTSGNTDGGSEVQFMTYTYDAVGNMKARWDSRSIGEYVEETFSHDAVNRLKKSEIEYDNGSGMVFQFTDYDITYDAGGRRSTLKHGGEPTINYSYGAGPIHGIGATTDGKSYVYDQVGNQINSDGRILNYTAFNKAANISKGTYHVEYTYGTGNEKLTRKDIEDGEETLTWYVGNVEIILTDWTDGIAGRIKSKRYMAGTMVTHHGADVIDVDYLHTDHLGSVQVISSQRNDVKIHMSYDAFGKHRGHRNPEVLYNQYLPTAGLTNKGFTGQDHVGPLSLVNFNARMYDPNLGMMLQADTVVPDGPAIDSLNRYAYVYNNPLSYTDPSGHTPMQTIDPWHHLREAAKRREEATRKFYEFMGDMGYGGMFASRFVRTSGGGGGSGNDNAVKGVSNGSMGNGDTNDSNVSVFGINSGLGKSDAQKESFVRASAHNASCVYSESCTTAGSFKSLSKAELEELGLGRAVFQNSFSGFKAKLFYDQYDDHYQLAFAGTEADVGDVIADIEQALNKETPQYNEARELGLLVSRAVEKTGASLSYTGHSLGGGLASYAAITTNNPAITFNAAGLNWNNRISSPYYRHANSLVQAYYVDGEFLSYTQDHKKNVNLPAAIGTRHMLKPASSQTNMFDLHRQLNVCMALNTYCSY